MKYYTGIKKNKLEIHLDIILDWWTRNVRYRNVWIIWSYLKRRNKCFQSTKHIYVHVSIYVTAFVYYYMEMKQYVRRYTGLLKWLLQDKGVQNSLRGQNEEETRKGKKEKNNTLKM